MTYENWILNPPTLRPRTYLYHLEPIGIGTPLVESLTSYIGRLAAAHAVSMGILSTKEFGPRVSKVRGTGQHHGNPASYSTFLYDAHILNGIGRCTERWVPMIEALTGQPNLHLLTALTWKQVISAQGLLRTRRAWCPACYAEWTTSQGIAYEPLLWSLAAVSVCPRHRVCLVEVCPHCRQESGALSGRWRAGYCSRCRRWLGSDRPRPESAGEDDRFRLWVAENIGALLARAASFVHPPQADALRENLLACINDLADGNHSALARALCLHECCFRRWLSRGVPGINSLMRVCFRLGFSVERFLTKRLNTEEPHWERAREIVRQSGLLGPRRPSQADVKLVLQRALRSASPPPLDDLALKLGFKRAGALRRRDRITCALITKRRAEIRARKGSSPCLPSPTPPKQRIRKRLEAALAQESPPSVPAIAEQLGFKYVASLYRRFPVLCRRLAAIRREHRRRRRLRIETAFRAALTEEPAPTLKQVAYRLGYKTTRPYDHYFSSLLKTVAAHARNHRQQQKSQIRAVLEAALKEDPPPLMQTVARRVGLTRGYLTELFPGLWQRLGARSKDHRMREAERKRQMLRQEAREIARGLLKTGTPPTRRLVATMIVRSPIRTCHLITKEIRKVEEELQKLRGKS